MEWFQKAIETGAFEEQTQPAIDDSENDNSEGMSNASSQGLKPHSGANADPVELHFPSETSPMVSPVSAAISQSSGETHRAKPPKNLELKPVSPKNLRLKPVRPQRSRLLSAVTFVLRYDRSFYDACSLGNYISAKKLLEQGANINAVSEQSFTALGRAAATGDQKMVSWLLINGADANMHGKYGSTPLCCAVEKGSVDSVALLIEGGADFERRGSYRRSVPLQIAASKGHTEIARQLLAHGAKVNPWVIDPRPLEQALKAGHDETAQLLIESGAVTTMGEAEGRFLLLHAVKSSCQRSLKMLLERGVCNLETEDYLGFTALDYAVQKDDLSMACSLLSAGAINHKSSLDEKLRREFWKYWIPIKLAKSAVEGYQRLADFIQQPIIP
jgi:ankyrin repeat protein